MLSSSRVNALPAVGNPINFRGRRLIADFALKNRLPSIYDERIFVDVGGLMSYAPSFTDSFRRAATYVDKSRDHRRQWSEFYSRRTDAGAYQHGIQLVFSRPGKPMDNPFIDSFNGRLRDEHLNVELFFSVGDAQHRLLEWQRDYNQARPHSSLGNIPPREFVAHWQLTDAAGGEILNPETV